MPGQLPRPAARLAATAASLALAGCGSGGAGRTAPAAAPATGSAGSAAGSAGSADRALFARACGGCHTLAGRESPRHQGGDLLHLRIGRTAMLQFVAEMPVRRPLTRDEIHRVSEYVLAVEAQGR